MVMESGPAPASASQLSDRSKDSCPDAGTESRVDRPRSGKRLQPDLSGFVGTDLWMVGKYER